MMVDPAMKMEKVYATTSSTIVPLLMRPKETRKFPTKAFGSFRSDAQKNVGPTIFVGTNGRTYNDKAAASNTANTHLVRILKGRHLQVWKIPREPICAGNDSLR